MMYIISAVSVTSVPMFLLGMYTLINIFSKRYHFAEACVKYFQIILLMVEIMHITFKIHIFRYFNEVMSKIKIGAK